MYDAPPAREGIEAIEHNGVAGAMWLWHRARLELPDDVTMDWVVSMTIRFHLFRTPIPLHHAHLYVPKAN